MSSEEYDLAVNAYLMLEADARGLCGKIAHSDDCRCDVLNDEYREHVAGCDACRAELPTCKRAKQLLRAIEQAQPSLQRRLAVLSAHQQNCAACRDGKPCRLGAEVRSAAVPP